ncbi:MAG: hypothetical protein GY780_11205 [bacterium]|nr:hypothetical protein [bacterium]
MTEKQNNVNDFECVQPEAGNEIWRLEMPDTEPELRTRLENHLAICDSCRLTLAVHGQLQNPAQAKILRPPFNFGLTGVLALAASLALAFILPPGQMDRTLMRGDSGPAFISPIEGEVVLQETPQLKWSQVPGATSYEVRITGVSDDYEWTSSSSQPTITIAEEHGLAHNQEVRVVVKTVPGDLVPLGSISVQFSREGPAPFVAYRVVSAPLVAKFLALAGLIFILLGWFRSRTTAAH